MSTDQKGQANWRAGVIGCFLGVAVFGCIISFFIGGIIGQLQLYKNQYREERSYVEPRIKKNPAFEKVTIGFKSDGGIYLWGEVATKQDLGALRAELNRAIGEPRAEEAIQAVVVGGARE